jgi:hypothetical protein
MTHSTQQTTQAVDGFIGKIGAIPSNTNWTLTEHATGTWSEQQIWSATHLPGSNNGGGLGVLTNAGGGLVLGGSGMPKADDIPSLLSNREFVVQTAAVDKYGVGMLSDIDAMRFGDGGSYSGDRDRARVVEPGAVLRQRERLANALTGSAGAGAQAAMQAAAAQADAAEGTASRAGNTVIINLNGISQFPSPEDIARIKMEMAFAAVGAP